MATTLKVHSSFLPATKKNVLLLSCRHNNDKIDNETENAQIQKIRTTHNSTKRGLEAILTKTAYYNCFRSTHRWQINIFYSFLNINPQVLYVSSLTIQLSLKLNLLKILI